MKSHTRTAAAHLPSRLKAQNRIPEEKKRHPQRLIPQSQEEARQNETSRGRETSRKMACPLQRISPIPQHPRQLLRAQKLQQFQHIVSLGRYTTPKLP